MFAFILLNLSWFYAKSVTCSGGSLSVISFANGCQPGQIVYYVRGFPIEFFWSNNTGFVLFWYLIDYLIFFIFVQLLLTIIRLFKLKLSDSSNDKLRK